MARTTNQPKQPKHIKRLQSQQMPNPSNIQPQKWTANFCVLWWLSEPVWVKSKTRWIISNDIGKVPDEEKLELPHVLLAWR